MLLSKAENGTPRGAVLFCGETSALPPQSKSPGLSIRCIGSPHLSVGTFRKVHPKRLMAKRFHYTVEQWLPYPLETVFTFFADPANLPRLMPAWQDARIDAATYVAPPPPLLPFAGCDRITAGTGTELTLTIKPVPFSPFRIPWLARIEDFRWLEGFCDNQVKGPFAYWRHCHSVHTEVRNGIAGTHLNDAVEYAPPLGPLGSIANTFFIRRQLAATFRFRQRRTLDLLAAQK
jgi:ligand-binding SRPBCC domain-containing protein